MSTRLEGELFFDAPGFPGAERSPATGRLRRYLASTLRDGFPPSLSLAVVGPGGIELFAFGGHGCVVGPPVPATAATSYDLASLTKVVCTVTLTLVAVQGGQLGLDNLVSQWLPAFPSRGTTLRHLLTHTSGLIEHRPFYRSCRGRAEVEAAVYEEARAAGPPSPVHPVRYSDLNYMLLGWVLENCFGQALDRSFSAFVAGPLGMGRAQFCPPPSERPLIAATELDGDQRLQDGLVWGTVHDGNAAALGGVSGHAGLFAPVADVARYARMLLLAHGGEGAVLSSRSVALLASRQAEGHEDTRGLGWRLEPNGWGAWPPGTVWHTGFTGTSLLVDLSRAKGVVLLTNAVHPHRRPEELTAFRAEVHRLLSLAIK